MNRNICSSENNIRKEEYKMGNRLKRNITIGILIGVMILGTSLSVQAATTNPFDAVWTAINNLNNAVANLQHQVATKQAPPPISPILFTETGTFGGAGSSGAGFLLGLSPANGTLKNLNAFSESAPGTGIVTITVLKNFVTTSLACTITGTVNKCSDTIDSVPIVQGDYISVQINTVDTPTFVDFGGGIGFTS